ncbi:hypothetical protein QAD02_008099 [Eretmocerus hayati]|uniref:Uncharacterized protein n=1 Tax=Eretmocerus hayati TaxID=131215 RepID=A0ACC2N5K1_9HYME|nr:hypothetical protein QAD02_008099 [Eretmocerus hayati]
MEESSSSTKGMEKSSSKDLTTIAKSRHTKIPHPLELMEGIVPRLKCPNCQERLALIRLEKLVPEVPDDEDEGIDVVTVNMNVSVGIQTPQSMRKNVECFSPKNTTVGQIIRCKRQSTRLLEQEVKRAK